MTGEVTETYAAAIQHELVDLRGATPVGVVRRPTGWFHGVVAENVPAVAPPEPLLDEVKSRQDDLAMRGLCDEEAHNAAWEEVDFEERYRAHLESDPDAREALEALHERVAGGESIALVCFEGEDKRCHRHTLLAELERMGASR